MDKKLTQEELLEHLWLWHEIDNLSVDSNIKIPFTKANHEDCKQAYTQLKEIVEEHFKPNNKSIGVIAKEYGIPYSLVHALEKRVVDDVQKPTMTREEIARWASMINDDPHQCTEESLIGILTTLGITVEVK